MNKLSKMIIGAAVSAMVLSGCANKEVVAPSVTNPNQFPNGVITKKVSVSIQVTGSSENGRVDGLTGAQVIIAQNGNSSSKTVDKDGIAIFTDLNPGEFRYFVSLSGYGSINNTGNATDASGALIGNTPGGNNSNQVVASNNALKVVLPRLGAAHAGKIVVDDDLDVLTPTKPVAGVRVRLYYGELVQPNLFYTTTDANGNYRFANVLETNNATSPAIAATVSIDTVITGLGGDRLVVSNTYTPTIRYGATGQQANIVITPAGQVAIATGTVIVKPWGNFDLVTETTGGTTFVNETNFNASPSSKLVASGANAATVKLVISSAILPAGLATEYVGTQNADGTYTFTNVPIGKAFKFVAVQNVTVKVAPLPSGNDQCLAITRGSNAQVASIVIPGVNGGAAVTAANVCPNGAAQVGGYDKTVVFFKEIAATTINVDKKLVDLGLQELVP